ncbi:hypothetical protein ACO3UB_08480 (plasmid) [Methanocaldococcus sp. 16A]
MQQLYMPSNFTIYTPSNPPNTSLIIDRFSNITFIYKTPIDFLSMGIGDFWPMFIYALVMIAVVVKFKNPLPIAFASLLTSLMLIPISPDACKYTLMFVCAFSLTASAFLFVKR